MGSPAIDERTLFGGAVSTPTQVLVQELPDDECIFLDLRTESYSGLDPVGTRMYRAIVSCPTVAAAYEQLLGEFDVEPERLRADLHAFVLRLVERGLLEFHAS